MKVTLNVAVRDAAEQAFIDTLTVEVKKFLDDNKIAMISELIFARKSSYAGVRADDMHVRKYGDGHYDFWVNIKECSSSVNYALTRLAGGLHYWMVKAKQLDKKSDKAAFIASLGLVEENKVAEPVERPRAAAPKVKKENKGVIIKKHGVTIRGFHEHKLVERDFIERLVAFTEKVLPIDNKFNDIKFSKRSSKLDRYSSDDLRKNGFDVSVGERVSGTVEDGKGKLSTEFSIQRFDEFAFAMAVYRVMQMLKLDLAPVKALKPTPEDVTFAVMKTGVSSTDYAATVALTAYAAQMIG